MISFHSMKVTEKFDPISSQLKTPLAYSKILK